MRLARLLSLILLTAALTIPAPAAEASTGYMPPVHDDYPVATLTAAHPEIGEDGIRQCGTFALWRVDRDHHRQPFTTFGELATARPVRDAADIDDAARAAGLRVDSTPAVGALAVLEPGRHEAGPTGHVAYVARVYPGAILVEQYNWDHPGMYETLVVPVDWSTEYVHF